jgi:hypothetical protein
MKKLICILSLVTLFSCRKEDIELNQTHSGEIESNEVDIDGIVFSTTPRPLGHSLRPNDFQLIDDSFYVSTPCAMTGVTMTAFNYGGETHDVKLRIDGNLIDIIENPVVNPYNILDFNFNVSVKLSEGNHEISFRGISTGPNEYNVHFQIRYFTTLQNLPVYNLPVDKRRKYKFQT